MTCLSVPGVYIVLYADDILLIAPSICGLDAIVKTYEFELNKLDVVVSTRKSCCLRVGPRNNASCLSVSLSADIDIPWVSETRYLGIFIMRSRTFKCSLKRAKKSLSCCERSFCKDRSRCLWRSHSPINKKKMSTSAILYDLEACPLCITKSDLQFFDFVINIFENNYSQLKVVKL